jgi:hypothetical protein
MAETCSRIERRAAWKGMSNESFAIDSEDALLRILLALRHPPLLCHIWSQFVIRAALPEPFKKHALCDRTESLWRAVSDRLAPPPVGFDSLIISTFPPLFEEFQSAVAVQPRRFPREVIPPPLRRPREHSDAHRGHRGETFRRLHAGEVGVARRR